MSLNSKTFKGGIHPVYSKELSQDKAIENLALPEEVKILLRQHVGAECEPLVAVGDLVKTGQKIGQSEGFISATVHASVSGTIKKIEEVESPNGEKAKAVIIESDGKDEFIEGLKTYDNLDQLSVDEIKALVKEAGITGQGGASFPTHVKLSPPDEKNIDILVLNGAECEPYLTADHRIMVEHSEEVVFGIQALMKALKVEKAYVGIEDNKTDAIEKMIAATKEDSRIEVVSLKTKYPQGDEKRIIQAMTERIVPSGKLPLDVGVVVNNVGTAYAVAKTIKTGMPLIERVVTVTGESISEPKNLMVRIGTSFKDVIKHCGGVKGNLKKIIMGGPMMGISQYTDEVPVIKGTSGILMFSEEEAKMPPMEPCIRCAKCTRVCPVYLQPVQLGLLTEKSKYEETEKFGVWDCIECGSCSFICPAQRPLVQSIRVAKNELMKRERR